MNGELTTKNEERKHIRTGLLSKQTEATLLIATDPMLD